jgi:hypothetical protein
LGQRGARVKMPGSLWEPVRYRMPWETFIGHLLKEIFEILFPKRAWFMI